MKHNLFSRILSAAVAMALVVSIVPGAAFADDAATPEEPSAVVEQSVEQPTEGGDAGSGDAGSIEGDITVIDETGDEQPPVEGPVEPGAGDPIVAPSEPVDQPDAPVVPTEPDAPAAPVEGGEQPTEGGEVIVDDKTPGAPAPGLTDATKETAEQGKATTEDAKAAAELAEATPEQATPETAVLYPAFEGKAETAGDTKAIVKAKADEGILPSGVKLIVEELKPEEDSHKAALADAEKALEDAEVPTENMMALDIRFELDGKEIEPKGEVQISIELPELLPADEAIDPESVAINHIVKDEAEDKFVAEPVADASANTAEVKVEATTVKVEDAAVTSFSTFTVTWTKYSYYTKTAKIWFVDQDGNQITGKQSTKVNVSGVDNIVLESYNALADNIAASYTYKGAYLDSANGTKALAVSYNGTESRGAGWYYMDTSDKWQVWQKVGQYTTSVVDVYLVYEENSFDLTLSSTGRNGDEVTLNAVAQNADAETPITYAWEITSGASYAALDTAVTTAANTLTWKTGSDNQSVTVTVTATQGTKTAQDTITLQNTTYTLTYNENVGRSSRTQTSDPYHAGDIVTLSAPIWERSGYIFAGWGDTTDGDDQGVVYSAGDKYEMGAKNVTLYARWIKLSGKIGHIDIRITGANIHLTTTIKDTLGNELGTVDSFLSGKITKVVSATLTYDGRVHDIGAFEERSNHYEYTNKNSFTAVDFEKLLSENGGQVSATVVFTPDDGTDPQTVTVNFSDEQLRAARANCPNYDQSSGTTNTNGGLDFNVDSGSVEVTTKPVSVKMTVEKTFTGLSETELAALENNFAITVGSDLLTLKLNDAATRAATVSGTKVNVIHGQKTDEETGAVTHTWAVEAMPNGAYTVTETGAAVTGKTLTATSGTVDAETLTKGDAVTVTVADKAAGKAFFNNAYVSTVKTYPVRFYLKGIVDMNAYEFSDAWAYLPTQPYAGVGYAHIVSPKAIPAGSLPGGNISNDDAAVKTWLSSVGIDPGIVKTSDLVSVLNELKTKLDTNGNPYVTDATKLQTADGVYTVGQVIQDGGKNFEIVYADAQNNGDQINAKKPHAAEITDGTYQTSYHVHLTVRCKTGDLVITKTFANITEDQANDLADALVFTATSAKGTVQTLEGVTPEHDAGTLVYTYTYTDIPLGAYTVAETADSAKLEGYRLSASEAVTGVVVAADAAGAAAFTNSYSSSFNDTPTDELFIRVQKSFEGLSDEQIAALADNFAITVNNAAGETVGTLKLNDNGVQVSGTTYTWKLAVDAGIYTVIESGAETANTALTVTVNGADSDVILTTGAQVTTTAPAFAISDPQVISPNKLSYSVPTTTNVLAGQLTGGKEYFVWTAATLSAAERTKVLQAIAEKKSGFASITDQGATVAFYSGDQIAAEGGIVFRGRKINLKDGTLSFGATKQFAGVYYGTYTNTPGVSADITIENTYVETLGSLFITKSLDKINTSMGADATFIFTITGGGKTYHRTITFTAGGAQTVGIANLPAGEYTITESKAAGYNTDSAKTVKVEGGVSEKTAANTGSFANTSKGGNTPGDNDVKHNVFVFEDNKWVWKNTLVLPAEPTPDAE